MNCKKEDLLLYGITDRSWLNGKTLYSQVEGALKGGVTFLQLREKSLDQAHFRQEVAEIRKLCKKYGVPLIINDNVRIAKEIDADGVHVGQGDLSVREVRRIGGEQMIVGVSAHNVAEARAAWRDGADYLGAGAMFSTSTKTGTTHLDLKTLEDICRCVPIPVVAIGGIQADNILSLAGSGIAGAAVVSAVFGAEDIEAACRRLAALARHVTEPDRKEEVP